MNPWIVRTLLYPLHERMRGRPTYRFLSKFRPSESLPPSELAALTDRAVSDLVHHAFVQVPWWREASAERGLTPGDIRGAGDLHRLPTMDKEMIRGNLNRLVADNRRDSVFQLATGGSSGEPLIFYTDKKREASQLAAKMRSREWWGIRMGDRQADMWGSPIESAASSWLRVKKDRFLNYLLLDAFALSDEKMSGFKSILEDHRTQFVYGYASVLARYARFIEERGEDLTHLGLKAAISTAELLFPDQRAVVEKVFGCRVVDEYGCRDGGTIAQECPDGRMHIASDTVHLEIVDDEGQPVPLGESGEIAVTNLWSHGMPLIRYRLGDRACLEATPCDCGRSLPVLGSLEGRVTDTLHTPDGNRVHGLGLMYVLRVLPGVRRFQVVQDELDHVEVMVVVDHDVAGQDLLETIRLGVQGVLGDRMRVEVTPVEEIPVLPSGKMRSIYSRLQ